MIEAGLGGVVLPDAILKCAWIRLPAMRMVFDFLTSNKNSFCNFLHIFVRDFFAFRHLECRFGKVAGF